MRRRSRHRSSGTRLRRVVWIAFVSVLVASIAQTAVGEPRSVRFQHISRDHGLSQAFVYTIAQDSEGYMWFGTQEGLNRFDGFEFTVFAHDMDDPRSISDETVRTMIIDQAGALWIGTDAGGLSRYDQASRTFTNYLHDPEDPKTIGDNRVRVVFEDSAGVLWVGTDGAGLDRFDRGSETFEHYPHQPSNPDSLSGAYVWSIVEDSDGTLWVATDQGLSRLDRSTATFSHFMHDPDDPTTIGYGQLRVLYEDANNVLWIGTESSGLNRFDRATQSFKRYMHDPADATSISANRINAIFQDDGGILWIGTVDGLNAWNPITQGFERYYNDPGNRFSLSHNNVLSIYQDRGGLLWVGTYNGLSKWNQAYRGMLHYKKTANEGLGLNENTVTSFAEDPTGDIWVGTFGGGLNRLDRSSGQFRYIRNSPDDDTSLSSDHVMAVQVDSNGVLWVGTRSAGLNRYDADANTFIRYRHDPLDPMSISADGVTYILEDSNNALWIGTFGGGLNRLDRESGRFQHYRSDASNPHALSNDRVLVLFEDSTGIIWIGTYGGGLNRFEPGTGQFTHYRGAPDLKDGLSGDEIYMIQEDEQGDLWIAVKGAGLNRWRRTDRELGTVSFQRFTELDGLPSATIYSGVWDQASDLWLSTGHGLSRLDTNSLTFRNYDVSHGLQGDEFNLAAGYRARDGQIFFGGMNGFNAFQPESLAANRQAPQVVITTIASLDRSLDLGASKAGGEPAKFGHDQRMIAFEFAALDYAAPEKNRYQYRLDGFDENWVDPGTQRRVTYTNLPPGDYTFRVKASNNDGVWSESDAAFRFSMNPAPWRTGWAYLVYLLLLVAIVLAAFRTHARKAGQAAKLKYADELKLIEERLTEAQRIAKIGNWELNTMTKELWWSDEINRLFQFAPGALGATYESFLETVHPDDRDAVRQAMERALHNDGPYVIDHRIIRPDGTERVVHSRAEVTFNEDGKPVRMAGTVHDITDRIQAENDIKDHANYQSLLAQLSSALIRPQPDDIADQLSLGLGLVGDRYDLDAISILWSAGINQNLQSICTWERANVGNLPRRLALTAIPWIAEQLPMGDPVIVDDVARMPQAAAVDQKLFRLREIQSLLVIPLRVDRRPEGLIIFSTTASKREWTDKTVTELKLVSENLAGAIARSRATAEIQRLKDQLQEENLYLRQEVKLAHVFEEIVGQDPELKRCLQAVEKVAPTDITVLILGETGTGKELFARAIHKLSTRRDGPMVSVSCPALPANLIESELFGHQKGAFTGAQALRRGRFELAKGGTLFLDEIGDFPVELQSKLLRVLQTGEFERLGGTETLHADVRLIAATNRDLRHATEQGEFRADLFYRISSFPIRLPALRDRKGDIALLAEHFVHKHSKRLGKKVDAISGKMLKELTSYPWPGNVRELESIIERALISTEANSVLELPGPLRLIASMQQAHAGISTESGTDLFSVERTYILKVLEHTNWRISGADGAASVLGIPSSTLRSKMKRLGITRQSP